jgi:hypothetical protein
MRSPLRHIGLRAYLCGAKSLVRNCRMDGSIISALAALTGAAVGGLTSGIANWLNHRSQVRAQWLNHEQNRRQILYRDFIEEASKCYIDALQHNKADVPGLVGLYAKLSRMRVLSSAEVIERADDVTRKILDTYLEPDRSFVELREMAVSGSIDLLHGFSTACRHEFENMRADQF